MRPDMADKGRQVGHTISVIFTTRNAPGGAERHNTVVPARRAILCGEESAVGSGGVVCGEGAPYISHSPVWRRLDGDSRGRRATHAPRAAPPVPATHAASRRPSCGPHAALADPAGPLAAPEDCVGRVCGAGAAGAAQGLRVAAMAVGAVLRGRRRGRVVGRQAGQRWCGPPVMAKSRSSAAAMSMMHTFHPHLHPSVK